MEKILLHCCCGICASYPIDKLRELKYEPILYFYNPNISDKNEEKRRLEVMKKLAKIKNCELIIDNSDNNIYETEIKGYENEPEKGKRCEICFALRLKKSYNKSIELKIAKFTTTLSVSPHKNSKTIFKIAEQYENFLPLDFKKQDGFKKTMEFAKKNNFYIQNFCGCKYSIRG